MEREPSFRPVTPKPLRRSNWWMPVLLVGGSALAIMCALAFVAFAFLWQPAKPAKLDVAPTPGGAVVRYATPDGSQPVADSGQPVQTVISQTAVTETPAVTVTVASPTVAVSASPELTATVEADGEEDQPSEKPTKQAAQPSAKVADGFGYGIQVDPAGSPDEIAGHLNELGVSWVKFQIAWKDTEPEEGVYNWGEWDRLILAYYKAGMKILVSVPKAPNWARPSGTDLSQEGPPADPATYARFLGEMTQRYRGGIQAIEVWNEQNLAREGGGAPMPPADYINLLSASYSTVKAVDSSIWVISGAPTPAGDVPGAAIDDISYLDAMYSAGLKGVSDGIGVHPSGYNCPADGDWQTVTDPTAVFRGPYDNRHHSWCFRGTMEGYHTVMVANGDTGKKLWPTEFGWAVSSNPPASYEYAKDNTAQEQAQWVVSAYTQAKGWGYVGPMFLWNLNYGVTHPGSEQALFSILTAEGPTPAYQALADLN